MTEYKIDPMDVSFEPLAGSTFTNFLRLLAQNKFRIGMIGVPRTLYSASMCLALSPFNLVERLSCHNEIKKTVIDKPPIFIIGHWRSGTTYLHNLMSQNDQFAYPTTFQTVTPGLFLRFEHFVKPIVASSLPAKRPEDDIMIGADLPQEEEYGIGNLSPYSFYNGWCFPKNYNYYYRFVLMDDFSQQTIDRWKQVYHYFMQKLTIAHHHKQLVLKNPANTARVKLLLEMYPDAQFIHIYRNPFHTYLSMMRDIETEMTLYCVQQPGNGSSFENAMVDLYNKMFQKYFKERPYVPNGNLIEVRYEDLISQPYQEVERIHQALHLPGLKDNEKRLKQYIAAQTSVKVHNYDIDDELKQKIYKNFKTTIDAWGYNGTMTG